MCLLIFLYIILSKDLHGKFGIIHMLCLPKCCTCLETGQGLLSVCMHTSIWHFEEGSVPGAQYPTVFVSFCRAVHGVRDAHMYSRECNRYINAVKTCRTPCMATCLSCGRETEADGKPQLPWSRVCVRMSIYNLYTLQSMSLSCCLYICFSLYINITSIYMYICIYTFVYRRTRGSCIPYIALYRKHPEPQADNKNPGFKGLIVHIRQLYSYIRALFSIGCKCLQEVNRVSLSTSDHRNQQAQTSLKPCTKPKALSLYSPRVYAAFQSRRCASPLSAALRCEAVL